MKELENNSWIGIEEDLAVTELTQPRKMHHYSTRKQQDPK